jgi:hypothetical protein
MQLGNATAGILTAVICVLTLIGCSATVSCPRESENPRLIFLLNHGRHNSLVLDLGESGIQRYGYGDWRYYGQTKTGFRSAARALLWRTPAVLGRQIYDVDEPTEPSVARVVKVPVVEIYPFEVSAGAVDALRAELDFLFRKNADELWVNPRSDFEFVPHPRDYWLWHNSNHMIASWLEALGCEVRGMVGFSTGMTGAEQ